MRGAKISSQEADLYLLDRGKRRVPLIRWESVAPPDLFGAGHLPRSLRAFLRTGDRSGGRLPAPSDAFLELASGLVRFVQQEIVVRFRPSSPQRRRRSLLRRHGFKVLRTNPFVAGQVVVHAPARLYSREALIEIANLWAEQDTTDVSQPGLGFSPGLHTLRFGGTSAATALAAGVGALVLSVNPDLDRSELKELFIRTSDPIRGGVRLNAAAALEEAARRGR